MKLERDVDFRRSHLVHIKIMTGTWKYSVGQKYSDIFKRLVLYET